MGKYNLSGMEFRAERITFTADCPGSQLLHPGLHPPLLEDKAELLSFYFYPLHMPALMAGKRVPLLSAETERWARFPLSVSPLA